LLSLERKQPKINEFLLPFVGEQTNKDHNELHKIIHFFHEVMKSGAKSIETASEATESTL